MDTFRWTQSFGCEGGPAIVADAARYPLWTGSRPYPPGRQTTVHHWGQFTEALPERFRPAGPDGHQYLETSSYEEAVTLAQELIRCVKRKYPFTKVSGDGTWTLRRMDGRRMTIVLEPASAYDEYVRELDETRLVPLDEGTTALLWSVEGPGVVDVAETDDGRSFLMCRSWVDSEQALPEVRAACERGQDEALAAELAFRSGVVAAAWSALAHDDLREASVAEMYSLAAVSGERRLSTDDMGAVGTVLRVESGVYAVSVGAHEEDAWACRWCRAVLMGERGG